jgi:hypothetical protein
MSISSQKKWPSRLVSTLALFLFISVSEQSRESTTQVLSASLWPSLVDSAKPIQKIAPIEIVITEEDKDLYNELFDNLHCSELSCGQFLDSLIATPLLTKHNRKEQYDWLVLTHPGAKEHKWLIEKSIFLEQWLANFLPLAERIDSLLINANAKHLWSYDRYLSLSRKITLQSENKNMHYFIDEEYITLLEDKVKQNDIFPNIKKIIFPQMWVTAVSPSAKKTKKKPFATNSHESPRYDTIKVQNKTFISKHYPHQSIYDSLTSRGYAVVSSKTWIDKWENFAWNRTCLHWLQWDIVLEWLDLLEKRLWEQYWVTMDKKIIRWWTERGHFFWKDHRGFTAWQLYPGYNKLLRVNSKKNSIQHWTIKQLRLLFSMHWYGTTIDLSIWSPTRARAMENFLESGKNLPLWYQFLAIWENVYWEKIFIIYKKHWHDIGYHFHIWFATESQLQWSWLL